MYQLTEEQIKKAADWWTNAITSPKFGGLNREERLDSANDGYQIAEALATVVSKHKTDEQLEAFGIALSDILRSDEFQYGHGLHVDYRPDRTLHEAAKKAGIDVSTSAFPWKTNMWFHCDGSVRVRVGYGAIIEEI